MMNKTKKSFSRRLSQRLLIVFLLTITVVSVLIISLSTYGKQLLIYTDGLSEAEDADHNQLGNKPILDLISATANDSSREVIEKLIAAVEMHRNGAEPNDDLTLLCLKLQ